MGPTSGGPPWHPWPYIQTHSERGNRRKQNFFWATVSAPKCTIKLSIHLDREIWDTSIGVSIILPGPEGRLEKLDSYVDSSSRLVTRVEVSAGRDGREEHPPPAVLADLQICGDSLVYTSDRTACDVNRSGKAIRENGAKNPIGEGWCPLSGKLAESQLARKIKSRDISNWSQQPPLLQQ